jgi:large subunit ribosomal protein L11
VPADVTVYEDRSFTFVLKTPPASDMLRKAAGVERGSSAQKRQKVGSISQAQLMEIARAKMQDLNAADVEAAARMIEGSARSMGIEVRS